MVVTRICAEYTRFQCECGDYFDLANEDVAAFNEKVEHERTCTAAWDDGESEAV